MKNDYRLTEYTDSDVIDFFVYWLDRVNFDQAIDMCKEIYYIEHVEILDILKNPLIAKVENGK